MQALLQHPALWRGDRLALPTLPGVASGFPALDAVLPGGGWPTGLLTEILPIRQGIGELSLLAPALARLSAEDERWLVWIAPPHIPYAPALAAAGVRLTRLILVRPRSPKELLWATRQALASKGASAVLAWLATPDMAALRRLQLAAADSRALALIFRPPRAAAQSSPAVLRLQLEPGAATSRRQLAVHVLKRRGGPLAHPVLIDLARTPPHALDRDPSPRTGTASLPARREFA